MDESEVIAARDFRKRVQWSLWSQFSLFFSNCCQSAAFHCRCQIVCVGCSSGRSLPTPKVMQLAGSSYPTLDFDWRLVRRKRSLTWPGLVG